MVNFKLKVDALKLASALSISDNADSRSFFLMKYFLGSRLSPLHSQWSNLRDNSSPSSLSLTPYYSKVLRGPQVY